MDEPTPEPATPDSPSRHLDLSLFRLPVDPEPANAEVGIGQRGRPNAAVKRRFWGRLARRLDLTGPGSLVRRPPYGAGHVQWLAGMERRVDRLMEQLQRRENAQVRFVGEKTRASDLPRHVVFMIEEVTPQFFLRNIPRLERHTNVRHLNYQYAVWRDDEREMLEFARHPEIEPVEFLADFSTALVRQLGCESRARIHGLDWEHDVLGLPPAPFRIPSFGAEEKVRIPIEELRDEPAPAQRETSLQRHARTMKALGKRFDAAGD